MAEQPPRRPRGRPPKPAAERAPRRSSRSGAAKAPSPGEALAQEALLARLRVVVGEEIRRRGQPATWAAGEPCTWAALARVLGYKSSSTLTAWGSPTEPRRKRMSSAAQRRLEAAVARWAAGEDIDIDPDHEIGGS